MPILANNTKKMPVKMRVETVPWEARTVMVDGRIIINQRPKDPRPLPDVSTKQTSVEAGANRLRVTAGSAIPTKLHYTISDRDWKTWEPVFQEARDKFKMEYGSKSELEKLLETGKMYDGYQHWGYALRYREVGVLNIKFALQSSGQTQRVILLAAMYVHCGEEAQLATRTSIAHHARVGCSMWSPFSPADCKITPCCKFLCRDVPADGQTSRYEHGLHLAKKDLELARANASRARLAERVRDLMAANERLKKRCKDIMVDVKDIRDEVKDIKKCVQKRRLDDGEEDEESGGETGPGGKKSVALKRRRKA